MKTIHDPKDKKSVRGREASKLDTGNRDATYEPPIKGNLIDDNKAQVSIQGKLHNETRDSGTKDEQRTTHPKDDNTKQRLSPGRPRQAIIQKPALPAGPQDQDANSLSDPNPAAAYPPEPASSPAQVRQRGEEPAPVK